MDLKTDSHDAAESLDELLAEPIESALSRERAFADSVASGIGGPVILYGAGALGRRLRSAMRAAGLPVAAFADRAPRSPGSTVDGLAVLSPEEAALVRPARVIVAVFNPGHSYEETARDLRAFGCRHVESWLPAAWSLGDAVLPHYAACRPSLVLAARSEVLAQASVWADEASVDEYRRQVCWRLTGDFSVLPPQLPEHYFASDVYVPLAHETLVDCGAYDGDTLLDFIARVPAFGAAYSYEPDPDNLVALRRAVAGLGPNVARRVHVSEAAVGARPGTSRFSAGAGTSAALVAGDVPAGDAAHTFRVECVALDDALSGVGVTLLKMDIEGGEADALRGAAGVLRRCRPVLAVSAYHHPSDVWELPRLVESLTDDYRLFLRSHGPDGFECVLYAVPNERTLCAV
jgi:FkbM family methyltransferase